MKSEKYNSKWAVVTGGSEGIGKSIAEQLAASGCNVLILSRSHDKLSKALMDVKAKALNPSQKILSESCDVTNYSAVQKTLENFVTANGTPDYLFNCAGYAQPGYIQDLTLYDYRNMMDLNYFGLVHTCKTLVPHFLKAKKGHIINVSSMAGFLGLFGYTGYCASKFAVVGFSESLKRELKPFGIQVSVLCPPNTQTPGLAKENMSKPKEVLMTEEKAKTVSADYVATVTLQSVAKGKFMIVPTFDGELAYRLNRYAPLVIEQFVKRPEAKN